MKRINGYVKRHLGQGPNKDPLSWASERKEVEVALKLGGALWWFWSVRAMALAGAGALALEQGELDRAEEACEEGLELLAPEAREAIEAKLNLLVWLGWVA